MRTRSEAISRARFARYDGQGIGALRSILSRQRFPRSLKQIPPPSEEQE